jgi:hypothetical protein
MVGVPNVLVARGGIRGGGLRGRALPAGRGGNRGRGGRGGRGRGRGGRGEKPSGNLDDELDSYFSKVSSPSPLLNSSAHLNFFLLS